ncbi:MAG: ABC transporter ATP-binding protein [bacterium]|nr:ABC transporter ATP-binding protein [bacterium]
MLTIRNLSQTYGNGVQALKGISLDIPCGMFGLLGPNGAGKSTLMRTIATLQDCDDGSITLGDVDALSEKDTVRRLLGYLPQEFGVYERISAEDLLDHFAVLKGLEPAKSRRQIVHNLLEMTRLWDVRKQKLGTFSGGMRQRFGIAQALLGDPELIIVDEPTAGLDPEERQRFLNLLSGIGENVVVILSTHIVADVRELCTSLAIIDKGRVLLTGDPRALVDQMRGLIWERVVSGDQVSKLTESLPVISMRLLGGRTAVRVLGGTAPGEGFEKVDADLEDVYFATLKEEWTPPRVT